MNKEKKLSEILMNELHTISQSISHPIKNPLREAIIKCEESLKNNESEHIKEAIQSISKTIDNVDKIRQYLYLTTEKCSFDKTDISKIIEEILEEKKTYINEKQATVKYDKMPEIKCNKNQIKTLFSELIDNSVKFNKKNSKTKIEIQLNKDPEYWQFIIKDNGIAIEPLYKNLIFQLFQKIDFDNIYPGDGIGLAFCKKIVENHKGFIKYKRMKNKENVFTVNLLKAL